MINLNKTFETGVDSQFSLTLSTLKGAEVEHRFAVCARALGMSNSDTAAVEIMAFEWKRDELLEDAQKIGAEIFETVVSRFPKLKERALQMRLLGSAKGQSYVQGIC